MPDSDIEIRFLNPNVDAENPTPPILNLDEAFEIAQTFGMQGHVWMSWRLTANAVTQFAPRVANSNRIDSNRRKAYNFEDRRLRRKRAMETVQTPSKSVHYSIAIDPEASLAWGRIPSERKEEILSTFKREPPLGDTHFKMDQEVFTVRSMSSGFRVVYKADNDSAIIVSVMTPREARLTRD